MAKLDQEPRLSGESPAMVEWARRVAQLVNQHDDLKANLSDFGILKASNGWQKLPSGLIFQWGTNVTNSGFDLGVTLPIAWTTGLLFAGGMIPSTLAGWVPVVQPYTGVAPLTAILIAAWNAGARQTANLNWFALGY